MPLITIDPITVTTTVTQDLTANAAEILRLTVDNSRFQSGGNPTANLIALPFNQPTNPDGTAGTPVYASSNQAVNLQTSNFYAAIANIPELGEAFGYVALATKAWVAYRNLRLADLATVTTTLTNAQTALTQALNAVQVAKTNLTTTTAAVTQAQAVVTLAQAAVTASPTDPTAQANLTSAQTALQTAQNNAIAARVIVTNAQTGVGSARGAIVAAQTQVTAAQAAVDDPANPPLSLFSLSLSAKPKASEAKPVVKTEVKPAAKPVVKEPVKVPAKPEIKPVAKPVEAKPVEKK